MSGYVGSSASFGTGSEIVVTRAQTLYSRDTVALRTFLGWHFSVTLQGPMDKQVELVWDNSTSTFVERKAPTPSYLNIPMKVPLAHPSVAVGQIVDVPPQDYALSNPIYP